MSVKKYYGSFEHYHEGNWLEPLGFEKTTKLEDADVVVFGGGKDVDPGFYGDKLGPYTCKPSERDRREKKDFERVQELRKEGKSIKSVGVCRGLQLLCALSGGKLIQHIGHNHQGRHRIATFDKKELEVNSIHHQMIYPYKMDKKDYKILSWSNKPIAGVYLDGKNSSMWLPEGFKEIEAAYFVNTDSFGVQFHPEMMFKKGSEEQVEAVKWTQETFMKFFNNNL